MNKIVVGLSLLIIFFISGCVSITGRTTSINEISKEEAELIARQEIREIQKSSYTIVYGAVKVDEYWVVQVLGENSRYVWVDAKSGEVVCVNNNPKEKINCL